ncbi:S-layer homology domain-containing protein [Sporosarcina sp. A2]|uniref:S-layer homology domain-containing protein n=1 Tax=Sporosarcina sp. A2 TaxID=3393449 RepID=UPI003D793714
MLVRALKLDTMNRPATPVVDVKQGSLSYDIIATVVDENIMVGNLKKQFNPNAILTRAEMATVLVRAFDLAPTSTAKKFQFIDVNVKSFATPSIEILFANNITFGYQDHTFKPALTLTRAHFGIFLAQLLKPES